MKCNNAHSARRQFLLGMAGLGIATLLPTSVARAAVISDIGDAINKAGRQRMLSQRMAKAYCQVGLGILTDRSRKILDTSRQRFNDQLAELKAYAPTSDIKESYAELDTLWRKYQGLLSGKPNLDNARQIATINEDVLRVAHLATTQLELHAASNVGRLINVAGRQRMLSQRMAKFYMFRQWGISSSSMDKEAQLARREFVSALDALGKAQENDTPIKNELELARMQWLFLDEALKQQDVGGKDMMTYATNVATTSERLLEVMDRVTGHYARISAAATPSARKR
ncbi:MAG: type IV pili methyl-accepting chemotaxis transducer N-terminal domain-containing protein [Pseudomonadota bacterium]|nr:type IV pili methyl-accepting chemotaxis transducer N-terminal domain-containing protein [Pseudomonadota bacterium]MDP1905657.1 type IV pili methyl-accepting chemotaxis transducer N-terminal domain-containing protein [Pseudomonadota bacterium]MDP2353282.1 type IV pili methyl-accepting chemotaxis transducer N-terminal domain-containing protein [Pseudomonadota bacterium]